MRTREPSGSDLYVGAASDPPVDLSGLEGANGTLNARFWRKVEIEEDGCWVWLAAPNASGYGKIRTGSKGTPLLPAHRAIWMALHGPIDQGITVHHLCGERLCVRPDHLEAMDVAVHNALHNKAKAVCVHGHDLTNRDNVYEHDGVRHCRPCRRNNDRRRLGIPFERWKIKDDF